MTVVYSQHPFLDWQAQYREPLPFPVGESPYRCKGVPWIGTMASLGTRCPGGLPACLAAAEPALRAFLETPFMAGQLYDMMPMPLTDLLLAKLTGRDAEMLLIEDTLRQAKDDLAGIYRVLLRLASPKMVAKKLPAAAAQVYDFVDVKTELVSANEVVAIQRRLPLQLAGYVSTINAIYVDHALSVCGVKSAEVAIGEPTSTSDRLDVPIIVRWR